MANTWTTFRKARITCLSGANDSPFVFNDISKIKLIRWDIQDKLFDLGAVAKLHDDRFVVSFTSSP
jgi:hypothetical protein